MEEFKLIIDQLLKIKSFQTPFLKSILTLYLMRCSKEKFYLL